MRWTKPHEAKPHQTAARDNQQTARNIIERWDRLVWKDRLWKREVGLRRCIEWVQFEVKKATTIRIKNDLTKSIIPQNNTTYSTPRRYMDGGGNFRRKYWTGGCGVSVERSGAMLSLWRILRMVWKWGSKWQIWILFVPLWDSKIGF